MLDSPKSISFRLDSPELTVWRLGGGRTQTPCYGVNLLQVIENTNWSAVSVLCNRTTMWMGKGYKELKAWIGMLESHEVPAAGFGWIIQSNKYLVFSTQTNNWVSMAYDKNNL